MAVTMNLRTKSSYGSKQKRGYSKAPEKFLDFIQEYEFCDPCKEVLNKLNDHTSTFDIQASVLRQNIQKTSSSTHQMNCDFMKAVVFWYFNLGANSSLRSIIASSLNKLQDCSELVQIFDGYIKETIIHNSQLVEVIQRCFENCSPALIAIRQNLNQLYEAFIVDLHRNKDNCASGNVDSMVRVLLALESQGNCRNEDLLRAIQTYYFHENNNQNQMSGETKRNMALIWTHEIRHRFTNDFVKLLVDYILEKEVEESYKKWLPNRSSEWIIHLSIAFVILAKQDLLQLNADSRKILLHHLFDRVSLNTKMISGSGAADDPKGNFNLVIGVQHCATKHLSLLNQLKNEKIENVEEHINLVKCYEIFARDHLNHNIDKVRHMFKNIFEKVIELYEVLKALDNLKIVMNWSLETGWENKTKAIALTCLCKTSTPLLMNLCPQLPKKVISLLKDPTIESSASEVYENLMKNSQNAGMSVDEWICTWIRPLLKANLTSMTSLVRILKTGLKINQNAVLDEVGKMSKSNMTLAMVCFKLDRQKGGEKWRDYFAQLLVPASKHFEDSIRLQALDLIITSHSSKEDFLPQDLELICDTLKLSMVLQSSADRQEVVVLMKKLHWRISNALEKASYEIKQQYEKFIREQFEFFFGCFFEDASVSRRAIALGSIQSIVEHFNTLVDDLKNETRYKILLDQFYDPYEHNKMVTLEIITKFPPNVTGFDKQDNCIIVKNLMDQILTLLKSHKPPDSITAGYLAKYVAHSKQMPPKKLISRIFQELKYQHKIAQVSLEQAAVEGPMYTALLCLRSLLENSEIVKTLDSEFFSDILEICFDITEIISVVLNCDSPEGHLPMDLEAASPGSNITAQLLLLCAWRTSKEISLLFGQICCNLPTDDQIENLSSFFIQQLAEIRHRGAFEQAFAGFCQVCAFIWKQESLNDYPIKLLENTLNDLKQNEGNRFCATRRSAGIPYLIQALVTTEPKNRNYQSLELALNNLLSFCEDPREELRIHAYNILRSLYRDSSLGEVVSPYISKGLQVSILGFKAHTWPERNSATLLFSALCTRIFGVKRSKNELSKRNAMSARMFFHKFPKMYDFLLNELKSVAKIISSGAMCPEESALYPILILVAKLQPSIFTSNEDLNEKKYKMEEFVDPLNQCSGSSIFKIRELAAIALVSIIPKSQEAFENLLSNILNHYDKYNTNQKHGKLLQILYMVETCRKYHTLEDLKKAISICKGQIEKIFCSPDPCSVIRTSMMEILVHLRDLDLTFKCFPMNDDLSTLLLSNSNSIQIWTPLELEFQTKLQWEISKVPVLLQSKSSEVRKATLKMFLLKIQSNTTDGESKNSNNLAQIGFTKKVVTEVNLNSTNEAKATTNHYTSVKLNELIVAERDSECLELLLKLMVKENHVHRTEPPQSIVEDYRVVESANSGNGGLQQSRPRRGLHENLNVLEAEALLAFLMNEVSMKQNQTKQDDEHGDQGHYCCGSNDRIIALCIETCGVIMSSFQSEVSSKIIVNWINVLLTQLESSGDDSDLRLSLAHVLKVNRVYFWPLRQQHQRNQKTEELEALFYVYWYLLLNLALDEDYQVRKIISEIVQSQLVSTLIFQNILQDFASSQMPEMLSLVDLLHNNLLRQDPQEQLSEESSAFDKNETNAFRENSMVVEAIRPYLTNKSSSPSAGFGGELRPAFNLAFADSLTSK